MRYIDKAQIKRRTEKQKMKLVKNKVKYRGNGKKEKQTTN